MKNYNTISPSAKSLLRLKANTPIPYAKAAAALLTGNDDWDLQPSNELWYWVRVLHFEQRYMSINQLLQEIPLKNVLELSSGYSFRGLDMSQKQPVHYIDTDLPDVIKTKQQMLEEIAPAEKSIGSLELLPLNALDKKAFESTVSRFEDGPLTIVNEGLLMYLGPKEKQQLCTTICEVLQARGGQWITADAYVRVPETREYEASMSEKERQFFSQHAIEANKFASFEEAEHFFNACGLNVVKQADVPLETLSSAMQIYKLMGEQAKSPNRKMPRMRETWMLQPRQ